MSFSSAREVHDRIYPPPNADEVEVGSNAVAAAFEGMHHWEHVQRQKGDPMGQSAARSSLVRVVSDEAGRLYDAGPLAEYGDASERDIMVNTAKDIAMDLYTAQYGTAESYDPQNMSPHETMAGEWTGWGEKDSEI